MAESLYSHDWPAAAQPTPAERRSGAALLQLFRSDPPGQWGENRLEMARHYRDAIYVAIRRVMQLVAGSHFCLMRKARRSTRKTTFGPGSATAKAIPGPQRQGRDEDYTPVEDQDNPLSRLVSRPNQHESFGELAAKLVLQNRLTGVGPLWAVPNAAGRPVELYSLKTPLLYPLYQISKAYPNGAWRVQPAAGYAGFVGAPYGIAAGAVVPGEEVKRFMEPHPLIDWDGYSPLTAGARHLDVLDAINDSRKSAMDNGLQLDAMLIAPGMDEEVLNRFSARMTERLGGSRNARKFGAIAPPAGMGDSKATLQTFGNSPRDMDYAAGWEQETKFALALFGVPGSVAGLTEATNYSELYAAERQFHRLQSNYLRELAAWLTRVLAWPWCSFVGEYQIEVSPPPIDDHELLEQQLESDKGIRTVNERRAVRNLDPVEGGDVPEEVYLKWLNNEVNPEPLPAPGEPGGGGGGKPKFGGGPAAGAAPGADNPDSEGTGLPRERKSLVNRLLSRLEFAAALNGHAPALLKAWEESKHPRGQPENAGEFAPKAGAKAAGGGVDFKRAIAEFDRRAGDAEVARPPFPVEAGPSGYHKSGFFPGDPTALILREGDPVTDVPLADLTATQTRVRRGNLVETAHAADKAGAMRPIVVVRQNGKDFIYDGHHRATVAELAGSDTVPARVYEWDADAGRYVPAADDEPTP